MPLLLLWSLWLTPVPQLQVHTVSLGWAGPVSPLRSVPATWLWCSLPLPAHHPITPCPHCSLFIWAVCGDLCPSGSTTGSTRHGPCPCGVQRGAWHSTGLSRRLPHPLGLYGSFLCSPEPPSKSLSLLPPHCSLLLPLSAEGSFVPRMLLSVEGGPSPPHSRAACGYVASFWASAERPGPSTERPGAGLWP